MTRRLPLMIGKMKIAIPPPHYCQMSTALSRVLMRARPRHKPWVRWL